MKFFLNLFFISNILNILYCIIKSFGSKISTGAIGISIGSIILPYIIYGICLSCMYVFFYFLNVYLKISEIASQISCGVLGMVLLLSFFVIYLEKQFMQTIFDNHIVIGYLFSILIITGAKLIK